MTCLIHGWFDILCQHLHVSGDRDCFLNIASAVSKMFIETVESVSAAE